MKALASREAQAWLQVDNLLEKGRKVASVYDEATGMLEKLRQLAEYEERPDGFRARIRRLAQKYASRPALVARWTRRRWV